jgi:hypothetical protein
MTGCREGERERGRDAKGVARYMISILLAGTSKMVLPLFNVLLHLSRHVSKLYNFFGLCIKTNLGGYFIK